MSYALDISKGIDPIPVFRDIRNDTTLFWVDGKSYIFIGNLPFTLKELKVKGYLRKHADKALILKHADKALIKDLRTMETLHG